MWNADLSLASRHKPLIKVGRWFTQSTHALLSLREKYGSHSDAELTTRLGKLETCTTNCLALLGHLNVELSMHRHELVKPHLDKEYSSF